MAATLAAALGASGACGGDDGGGPGSDGAIGDGPGELDAAVDAPSGTFPFGGLAVWKDGCSKELWARWHDDASFMLTAIEAREVGGGLVARTELPAPVAFQADHDDVRLLFDGQDVPANAYQLVFELAAGPPTMVTTPIEPPFHEAAGGVTVLQAHRDQGRVFADVTATFDGSLARLRVYDPTHCNIASTTFATQPTLGAQPATIPIGVNPPVGTMLLLVFEGVDHGAQYGFYATTRIEAP